MCTEMLLEREAENERQRVLQQKREEEDAVLRQREKEINIDAKLARMVTQCIAVSLYASMLPLWPHLDLSGRISICLVASYISTRCLPPCPMARSQNRYRSHVADLTY